MIGRQHGDVILTRALPNDERVIEVYPLIMGGARVGIGKLGDGAYDDVW